MKEYNLDINLRLKHFHLCLIIINIISMFFSYSLPIHFLTILVFTVYYLCYSFTEQKSKSLEKKLMLVYAALMIVTLGELFFGIAFALQLYPFIASPCLYAVYLQFPFLLLDKHFIEFIKKPKLKYIASAYFIQVSISISHYLCIYNSFSNALGNRQKSLIAGLIIYYAIFLFYRWRKNKKESSNDLNENAIIQDSITNVQVVVRKN